MDKAQKQRLNKESKKSKEQFQKYNIFLLGFYNAEMFITKKIFINSITKKLQCFSDTNHYKKLEFSLLYYDNAPVHSLFPVHDFFA